MTDETPLDLAHAAMQAVPDDDALRLRYYENLADCELFLLLEGDTPRVFETGAGSFVLAFDREERLAEFAQGATPYAVMSGRQLAAMLSGQGIGLAVNIGAGSEILVPQEALGWLVETLAETPTEATATPEEIAAPGDLPKALLLALDRKLALMGGLADLAYLVAVTFEDGRQGHLLALIDPLSGAESALAQAVHEALIFSGVEAGALDVAFFRSSDAICARLARIGLRFDLPKPMTPEAPKTPGMDPEKPPILR